MGKNYNFSQLIFQKLLTTRYNYAILKSQLRNTLTSR
nr:MAG TPA: hypothetical protein [Caudoviricetes sp.]